MTGGKCQMLLRCCAVSLLCLVTELAFAADIQSVRLWRAPDNTRLVFDLSGPAEHTLFTLSNPERIVIDISNANFNADTSALALANTPLTGMRSAPRNGKDLRVVLDLSSQVNPKSFVLPPNQQYGNRLVIDLFDQDARPTAVAPPQAPQASPLPQTPTRSASEAGERDIIVAIDAGHGGEDPGAIGYGGARRRWC